MKKTILFIVLLILSAPLESATSSWGDWTPILYPYNSPQLPTFSTNNATYSLITRLAFFNIYFDNISGGRSGSGLDQLRCSLPRKTSSSQLSLRVPMGIGKNGNQDFLIYATLAPSTNTMLLWKSIPSGEITALTCGDFNHANIRQICLQGEILFDPF